MKQIIILSEEEARAVIFLLKNSWAPQEMQKLVYDLISRIEKELES